jgi:hypothetical protein
MAIGQSNYPTALDAATDLVEATNDASTTLTSAITNSAMQLQVASTAAFPSTGIVEIGTELIAYSSKGVGVLNVASGGRGYEGTIAAAASSGAAVDLVISAASNNVKNAAIIALETKLGTGSSTPVPGTVLRGVAAGASDWGKVANTELENHSISIAGNQTSLGGTITRDSITGVTSNGLIKRTGANTLASATPGTDFTEYAFSQIAVTGQNTVIANNAQGTLTLIAGTGIAVTTDSSNDTVTIATTGGSTGTATRTIACWTMRENQPPATDFATLDTRNSTVLLVFTAGSPNKAAVFIGVIPSGITLASGLKTRILWTSATAITGNCKWGLQFERLTTTIDSDSFDAVTEVASSAPATAGVPKITELVTTSIDGLSAGDFFRLRISRKSADTTSDTMAGSAQLIAIELQAV